jgi:heme/copper-type cytochrome/quinol oxidase subunit 2
MCAFAKSAYDFNTRNTQKSGIDRITIEATGDNFNWYFRYPGNDGVLGNDDDKFSKQNLFLPPNSRVQLKLKSKDYLYSFSLPELALEEIAVPGLEHEVSFKTKRQTTFTLLGDQFCGYAHESLIGKVNVRNQNDDFYAWDNEDLYASDNDTLDNNDLYETNKNDFLEWDTDDFYKTDDK